MKFNAKKRDGKPKDVFKRLYGFTRPTNPTTNIPFINPSRSLWTKGGDTQPKP